MCVLCACFHLFIFTFPLCEFDSPDSTVDFSTEMAAMLESGPQIGGDAHRDTETLGCVNRTIPAGCTPCVKTRTAYVAGGGIAEGGGWTPASV